MFLEINIFVRPEAKIGNYGNKLSNFVAQLRHIFFSSLAWNNPEATRKATR